MLGTVGSALDIYFVQLSSLVASTAARVGAVHRLLTRLLATQIGLAVESARLVRATLTTGKLGTALLATLLVLVLATVEVLIVLLLATGAQRGAK